MEKLAKRFRAAAQQFIEQQCQDEDVIGIFLTGSMVHGRLDPHSDVDIPMVLRPEVNYRERGNTWIDGVEIEYFKNPPQQIRSYFVSEAKSPHTAHMLAHAEVVYKASPVVDELVAEAKAIWQTPPPAARDFQIELGKYGLDDIQKDLADCMVREDHFAAVMVKHHLIDTSINLFCMMHRLYRTKNKRLHAQLAEVDENFALIIHRLLKTQIPAQASLDDLSRYMENVLGGKRSKEWVLNSPLDLM